MKPVIIGDATLYTGCCIDVLKLLPEKSVNTCITSPPYFGLRDYGVEGQIGLEETPEEYVTKMVEVFRNVRRVLRDDGTLWLNLGDSYGGSNGGPQGNSSIISDRKVVKHGINNSRRNMTTATIKAKDLIGIPWRVALALQADGWYLRQDIIWSKPNPMPESVTDRCTKAHEYIFLLSKSAKYYYDQEAIKEPATYGQPNSPQSINSPMGQGYTRRALQPVPAGWDQSSGTHGTIHKTGRTHNEFGGKKYGESGAEETRTKSGNGYLPNGLRNKRSVWTVSTQPYPGAHFATFPPKLIEPCVLAGSPIGGTVFDPFSGSGTTGQVSVQMGRKYIGSEISQEYQDMATERITKNTIQGALFA